MDKWEYVVIKLHPVENDAQCQLDGLGKAGWELIAVQYNIAYLKRKVM